MFNWSISRTDAAPTPTATARLRMSGARHSGDPMGARADDHGRRDDGSTGRSDPDLIDPDDAGKTVVPESAFVAEGRDDDGHRPSGYRSRD